MSSNRPLVIIDFDETLYKKDSLLEFCKYVYKKRPIQLWAMFPQLISTILYYSKLISTKKYKELFLLFLYGINEKEVEQLAKQFWDATNENHFNSTIVSIIKQNKGRVICISASPELYLKPILNNLKIELIGTIINYSKNRYTIVGENCKGGEKVKRLKKYLKLEYVEIEESYSDSETDRSLFDISKKAFKVNAKGEIKAITKLNYI